MFRRKKSPVPAPLVAEIEEALVRVDRARAHLDRMADAALVERRQAHVALGAAFVTADSLLREATALGRQHSYEEWMRWRHRLSSLGTARQRHLFESADDHGVLPLGCIQAVDTGMSGPSIGDLMHARSREPGAAAAYGVDFEAILLAPPEPRFTPATPARQGAGVVTAVRPARVAPSVPASATADAA